MLKKKIEESRIDQHTFENYDQQMVQRDLDYVARIEEKFIKQRSLLDSEARRREETNLEYATILEGLLNDNIEMQNWFGENASTIITSRYDDIVNGVDGIIEFTGDDGSFRHLTYAVDVTTAYNPDVIAKKLSRIIEKIKTGTLTEIKYFESENTEFKGEKKGVSHAIICASQETVLRLGRLWLEGSRDSKAKLANHYIQFMLLDELIMQLRLFSKIAKKYNHGNIATKFMADYLFLEKIREERKGEVKLTQQQKDDLVEDVSYKALKSVLEELATSLLNEGKNVRDLN